MNIALACGGTGGHIFPGLATARVLREKGHHVVLWMAGKDVEASAVQNWDGPVITVPAEGFASGLSLDALGTAWSLGQAALNSRRRMRAERPDVLLAMGSYASAGPITAALSLRIPVVLHEANVLPGRAVKLFARWATAVAAHFEETRFYLRRKDLVVTGMPIRRELEVAAAQPRETPPHPDFFTVFIMGGSRGAHQLNDLGSLALNRVQALDYRVRVLHLTGVVDELAIGNVYSRSNVPHEVHGFLHDMAPAYRAADLAICRAGAATCAELSTFRVPALLVPYPYAAKDHQTANARAMQKLGLADVVPERDLSEDWLVDYIVGCLRNPARLEKMRANAATHARPNGAAALAELVVKTAGSGRPPAAL